MDNATEPHPADIGLAPLAKRLLDELLKGTMPPSVLGLVPIHGGYDLHTARLAGNHPAELLIGFAAPDEWHVIGLAVTGRARLMAESDTHPRKTLDTRYWGVHFLARSGERADQMRLDPSGTDLGDHRPVGQVADLMARALGRPTDPPPEDSSELWTTLWLTTVAAEALTDWSAAVAAHPLIEGPRPLEPTELAAQVARATAALDWDVLHHAAANGRFKTPDLSPAEAAWLDAGAFSRHVTYRLAPLDALRARIESSPLAEQIDCTLRLLDGHRGCTDRPAA